MRDIRKNKEYYNGYLEYQHSRIEKKVAKLHDCKNDEDKRQRILLSLIGYEVDLLKAEFSNGASKEKMKKLLIDALDLVEEFRNTTKEDLVILLSLSIMLNLENNARNLVDLNKNTVCGDRLLNCLAEYIKNRTVIWNSELKLDEEYVKLDEVFKSENRNSAMLKYLNSWYSNHTNYAWFGSHLRDTDTYCGYWSFESAALTKMLDMDETVYEKNEYYPMM